jgi:putative transposase
MKHRIEQHHRRSLRLRHYDYAQPGAYFVTMVTHNRELLFGNVVDLNLELNDFGRIVNDEWNKSAAIRQEIELDAFVIMPNHVHCILILRDHNARATGRSPLQSGPSTRTLGTFVAGFKSAVTARINQIRGTPAAPVWQRNYYEHIIRNERSLNHIRQYILDNPARWQFDRENPEATEPEPENVWRDLCRGDRRVALPGGQ